jgi:hypothetical protein
MPLLQGGFCRRAVRLAVLASLVSMSGFPAAAMDRSLPRGSGELVVTGIVIAGDTRYALLDDGTGRRKRAPGQSIGGWLVEAIEPREVVLRQGDRVRTVAMFAAPASGIVRVERGNDGQRTANVAAIESGGREVGLAPPKRTDWEQVITHLLGVEGSAFNPEDPSKWGIKDTTLKAARVRRGREAPQLDDLMVLSQREARRIYREDFIREYNLDAIPDPDLAYQVFDAVVNHGPGFGLRHFRDQLARLSGIKISEQGPIGRETADAVRAVIARGRLYRLRDRMVNARKSFLSDLAERRPDIRRQLSSLHRRAEFFRP